MQTTYLDAVLAIRDYYDGTSGVSDLWLKVQQGSRLTATELNALKQVPGINYSVTNSGVVGGLSYDYPFQSINNTTSSINSNIPNASYGVGTQSGKVRIPANYSIDDLTGNAKLTSGATKVSTGTRVATAASKVTAGIAAVGIGMQLGKLIDETLYNVGDFFGLNPPEALNPQTWDSIATTEGGKQLIDALFGIEGDASTMYLPEELMGYMFQYWLGLGAYGNEVVATDPITVGQSITSSSFTTVTLAEVPGITKSLVNSESLANLISQYPNAKGILGNPVNGAPSVLMGGSYYAPVDIVTNVPSGTVISYLDQENVGHLNNEITTNSGVQFRRGPDGNLVLQSSSALRPQTVVDLTSTYASQSATVPLINVQIKEVTGISDDPDAGTHVNPNLIDTSSPQAATESLRQNYPQLFDGSVTRGLPDPSTGDVVQKRYVPVPYPNLSDPTKPTTGNQNQNRPQVDPDDSTQDELDDMTDTLIGPDTGTPTPPTDGTAAPDTGTGDTPTGVPPTGNASSLWAVYNPTQSELDSFGAWLWSSNLVDQIKKLFSDPMQAIIGVHKVYATPDTGAAQNIKVGYLDSGVSAAVVTDQYTTIDCGSVNLREYYGNVLDYSPYTEISLYLPFIGIVKLDTADVMRSTVSVIYHVDVITGACLADVKVRRDGAGGVLYQYSGSCIVTYPVSSGSYVGAVAGVLGIAGGIAGTIATGGALAPALLGGAMGATHLHTDVQHSGGFSGAPGAMGAKKPYLIISRAQDATPNFNTIKGVPATKRITLGGCEGFTKVDQMDLDGIPATSRELAEIETLLKQGVIL